MLKNSDLKLLRLEWCAGRSGGGARCNASGRWDRWWRRDRHGELSEVLGGGGEVELVAGAVWSSQPQPIELEDAFEVGEQHLDFLALLS